MKKLAVQNLSGVKEEMEIVSSFVVEDNKIVVLSKGEMHNETMHKVYISIVKEENNVYKLLKIEDETLWGKVKEVMTEIVHGQQRKDNLVFNVEEAIMEGCKIIALVNDDFDKLVNAEKAKETQMKKPEIPTVQPQPEPQPEEPKVTENIFNIPEPIMTDSAPSETATIKPAEPTTPVAPVMPSPVEPVQKEENIFDIPEINPTFAEPVVEQKKGPDENKNMDETYAKVINNLDKEIKECEEKLNRLKEIKEFTKISHADNKAYAEAIDSVTENA